ncbi:ATP-binding protein [Sphingomonas sp. SUN019]|uniref:ATP-binding protein n=1 Tax=Sphingomonas sp. SUN019 TaxID=2937788 RepID=UPI0021642F78|nr:ATP-binding protein [Sphingomonas sp. SUN019]UVO52095.1 ATP-binding protein [Sphingomonas sp. SUN019]
MLEGITFRTWLGAAIVAITAGIVFVLFDVQAALLMLAGGVAALLTATSGDDRTAPDDRVVMPDEPTTPTDAILEAIVEPVLLVRDSRVAFANSAAKTLLGAHIVGEDARTAIRHPAAAGHLLDQRVGDVLQPIELVGLGTLDQRWEMRVAALTDGTRVVHLIDRTGSYAAERMRVDFVANASHELRTPLSSILGYVETLADAAGEEPETRARFLKIVLDEAHRMERLVEDLMSLSRIEAEKFRLPDATVDLSELIDEVQAELVDAHDGRGRDVTVDVANTIPLVTGDRVQLSQLLHNLIGNAMKYGKAGTPIRVTLTADASRTIRLVVTDEGDGIAPEHLPRLTERFYRVDPGRSRSLGGTGLGLAIVKHIVERHRGRFDIASTLGQGTRVTVTLRGVEAVSAASVIKA